MRRLWTSILNGAVGHTYGAGGIWQAPDIPSTELEWVLVLENKCATGPLIVLELLSVGPKAGQTNAIEITFEVINGPVSSLNLLSTQDLNGGSSAFI